ncbi:uncharacterized protein SPSK_08004 [Sporothrix schenckii 1099-18]|uniref:Uncharacterized protein n=1 Tax=Sporothrix schenckii 1099-18 TaxID=1397361 RepID=A0A0F2MFK8_SPOSC|nr:uncharacterized protein SPSK_08004 [Sporothrix schenckii 1099-18]KJR88427.1 hypothetical protein SPSK_08004 [Sporothrix schenckii 1099-18]
MKRECLNKRHQVTAKEQKARQGGNWTSGEKQSQSKLPVCKTEEGRCVEPRDDSYEVFCFEEREENKNEGGSKENSNGNKGIYQTQMELTVWSPSANGADKCDANGRNSWWRAGVFWGITRERGCSYLTGYLSGTLGRVCWIRAAVGCAEAKRSDGGGVLVARWCMEKRVEEKQKNEDLEKSGDVKMFSSYTTY